MRLGSRMVARLSPRARRMNDHSSGEKSGLARVPAKAGAGMGACRLFWVSMRARYAMPFYLWSGRALTVARELSSGRVPDQRRSKIGPAERGSGDVRFGVVT